MLKTNYVIIGAGLSGLLMGMELSRRNIDYIILEKQKTLPQAKLHYLHENLSSELPFRLKEVDIIKNIFWDNDFYTSPNIEMMNWFSHTTLGKVTQNSMKYINGEIEKGWVPENGIENISDNVYRYNKGQIHCGVEVIGIDLTKKKVKLKNGITDDEDTEIEFDNIVSTIPLPFLVKMLGVKTNLKFDTEAIKMVELQIPEEFYEDIYQIVYIPKSNFGFSRVSILGKRVVAEKGIGEFEEQSDLVKLQEFICRMLPPALLSKYGNELSSKSFPTEEMVNWYGRYIPVSEKQRIELLKDLQRMGVYCLGRYSVWSYKRTDHIVKDVQKILNGEYV